MKIEKIGSKSDLVSNLKKAAQLSNIRQLELLGEYIRQEKDLKNLKTLKFGCLLQKMKVFTLKDIFLRKTIKTFKKTNL